MQSAYASGRAFGGFAFFIGVFAGLLTSLYFWRLLFLTLFRKVRWAASEHVQHALHGAHHDHPDAEDAGHDTRPHETMPEAGTGGYHPHERPGTSRVPLRV